MIIRHNIDPSNFDYLNDYKDTRPYVARYHPELLQALDDGWETFMSNWRRRFSPDAEDRKIIAHNKLTHVANFSR